MNKSETIGKLAEALSKAQGAIKGAAKDSANPFFKSKYADLASVWEACRAELSANGLAVIQTVGSLEDGTPFVDTTLAHSSGEWISERLSMKPVKADPQGVGSVITYMRRYGLQSIVGVAPEDDDGNAASGKAKENGNGHSAKVVIPDKEKREVFEQSVACLANADEHGLREIWQPYGPDETVVLWGMFNSQQRSSMKKLLGKQ